MVYYGGNCDLHMVLLLVAEVQIASGGCRLF